jgi:hypothetical protein
MSKKPMKLACVVDPQTKPGRHNIRGWMYDGTPFSIDVPVTSVVLDQPLTDSSLPGQVVVEQAGQQGDRVSVVLPAPVLTFGHNILVNSDQLSPLTMPGLQLKKIKILTPEEIAQAAELEKTPVSE